MSNFWQTVIPTIPAVLTALVAGQVAITRTSRLRRVIRANVELLDKLPADDPYREVLAAHVRDLVDVLAWREHRQFHPLAPLASRGSFRLVIPFAAAVLLWGVLVLTRLTGASRPETPIPEVSWLILALYTALLVATVTLIRSTAKLDRRQRRLIERVQQIDPGGLRRALGPRTARP